MQDRPDMQELLEAVRQFLERDVVPELEGTKKFNARVAANVIAIVQRELSCEPEHFQREWESLAAILGLDETPPNEPGTRHQQLRERNATLCQRIRDGDADHGEWGRAVRQHVRRTVIDKLTVANPKLLGAS